MPEPSPSLESPEPSPPVEPATAPALGKTLGRGAAWLMAGNVVTKGASLVTFGVVAALVTREDVGVWTMAFSFAAFTQFLRDGGVTQVLIQQGAGAYETLAGPVFWLGLLVNLAVGGLLAGLAPLASGPGFYNEPRLLPLLLIMALQVPLMTAATVWWARIQIDLRFARLSNITTISSLMRSVGTVVFAWLGYGPLSFVLPLPLVMLWENIAYYASVRDHPWKRPARVDLWRGLLSQSINAVFVTFAFAAVNQGPAFALGKFLTTEQLGVFSLGYQIVTQIDQLLAATAAVVLFSALAKLNQEPARQRAATLRAARLMTLMSSLASFAVVAAVGPLARLIWGEKWVDSILPAQILAVVFAWRVLLWVPAPALQAQGKFRFSAVLVLIAGVALTGAGIAGAVYGGGAPVPIAGAMAVTMLVVFLGLSLWGMAEVGVRVWDVVSQTVPTWLCAGVAGAGALAVHALVHPRLVAAVVHPLAGFSEPGGVIEVVQGWARGVVWSPAGAVVGGGYVAGLMEGLPRLLRESRVVAALDLGVVGVVFVVLGYVLFRLLRPALLREAAELVPAKLAFVRKLV